MMKIYSKVMLMRLELKGSIKKKKNLWIEWVQWYAVGMYKPID